MAAPSATARGPWLALASVGVVAALTWVVGPRVLRARQDDQLADRLGALDACVSGGAGRDDATLRRRRIAAAVGGDDDWPARCEAPAAEAVAVLAALRGGLARCDGACCAGDDGCATLDALAVELAVVREQLARARFEGEGYAALWSRAAALGAATPATARAPAPVAMPDPQALTPLSPRLYDTSALWARPDGGWTLLLHSRDWQLGLCDIAPDARARCRSAPPSVPVRGTVLLVDGALHPHPHVLVRPAPDAPWEVFDAVSGEARLRIAREPAGVTVLADGSVHALARDAEGLWLVDSHGGQARWSPGDAYGPPLLFGDRLLWPAAHDGGVALRERGLNGEEGIAFHIAGWQPREVTLQACSDAGGMAVWIAGDAGTRSAVALRARVAWAVAPASAGGGGLSCQPGAVTLTAIAEQDAAPAPHGGIRGRHALRHERCAAGGCSLARGEVEIARWSRQSRYVTASLGERLLLAWRSPLGDIRLRRGTPDALGDADTLSLFDDDAHGGFDWEHEAATSFARDGRALLLTPAPYRGSVAVFGWLVDDASARPIEVAPDH